ncbi:MAG TPA: amidohydrolase family protein, partial [bacterium]|nr:amidohydrolase family protein [bacterium]
MKLPPTHAIMAEILERAKTVLTVDSHQHLSPETPLTTDLVRLILMDSYVSTDLVSAGLPPENLERWRDPDLPLAKRWLQLLPFWKQVQHGSYARAILVTAGDLYGASGFKSLTEIETVSSRLSEDFRQPGLFERLFVQRCRIDTVLTQSPAPFTGRRPRFYWVFRPLDRADFSPGGLFEQDCAKAGILLRSASDLPAAMDAILKKARQQGATGFKGVAMAWSAPDEEELREAWAHRSQSALLPGHPFLRLYLARMAAVAAEVDIPVALHTGAPWTNWLDYRQWEPTGLIPLFLSFRETRFDLYHAGLPYPDQASLLAKTFPNVWHNLTWAHLISPEMARRCISTWLDTVPINKILGFGGDYSNETVVLTYGHLAIARENVASVLAQRI